MSCTAYIVYTFQLFSHHANFGQFKAKQVLSTFHLKWPFYKYPVLLIYISGRWLQKVKTADRWVRAGWITCHPLLLLCRLLHPWISLQ